MARSPGLVDIPHARLYAMADALGLTLTFRDGRIVIDDGHAVEIVPGVRIDCPCTVIDQLLTSTSTSLGVRVRGDLGLWLTVRPDTLRALLLDLSKVDVRAAIASARLDDFPKASKVEALLKPGIVAALKRERSTLSAVWTLDA